MQIKKNQSIKTKYLLSGLAICLVSLILVSLTSYIVSYNITASQSNLRIEQMAMKNATELDSWFKQQGEIVTNMVEDIQIIGNDRQDFLYQFMKNKIALYNSQVLDYYIGFADPARKMVSGSNWTPPSDYNCHTRVWYQEAVKTNRIVYTEPYVDAQTGEMVITISKVIKINGKTLGVLASDILVNKVLDIVRNYQLSENSYAFLLDNLGNFLVHPKKEFLPNAAGLKNINKIRGVDYSQLAHAMQNNKIRVVEIKDYDGIAKYFILSNINSFLEEGADFELWAGIV